MGTERLRDLLGVIALAALALLVAYAIGSHGTTPTRIADVAHGTSGDTTAVGGASAGYTVRELSQQTRAGDTDAALIPADLPPRQSDKGPFLLVGYPIHGSDSESPTWLAFYTTDSLAPSGGNSDGARVYQWSGNPDTEICAQWRQVTRTVDGQTLSICLGDSPTPEALSYWKNIPFVNDPSRASWVPDNE